MNRKLQTSEQVKLRQQVRAHCVENGVILRDVAEGVGWTYARLCQKLGGFMTMTDDEERRVREAMESLTDQP